MSVAVPHQVFEILEASDVKLYLRGAEPRVLTDFFATKTDILGVEAFLLGAFSDERLNLGPQTRRLRRELVRHLKRSHQSLGDPEVLFGAFDVPNHRLALLRRLHWTLILMKKRHALNQRQVLHVVPARSGSGVRILDGIDQGVDDAERS